MMKERSRKAYRFWWEEFSLWGSPYSRSTNSICSLPVFIYLTSIYLSFHISFRVSFIDFQPFKGTSLGVAIDLSIWKLVPNPFVWTARTHRSIWIAETYSFAMSLHDLEVPGESIISMWIGPQTEFVVPRFTSIPLDWYTPILQSFIRLASAGVSERQWPISDKFRLLADRFLFLLPEQRLFIDHDREGFSLSATLNIAHFVQQRVEGKSSMIGDDRA
jgi:hypothetical protein